jgi:hypothetical protein
VAVIGSGKVFSTPGGAAAIKSIDVEHELSRFLPDIQTAGRRRTLSLLVQGSCDQSPFAAAEVTT